MKKKTIIIISLSLLLAFPAYAVFNERDFAKTLNILRSELHQENEKLENRRALLVKRNASQHQDLINTTKRCNELALILYSQNPDYTFDLTYALEEVTAQYEQYNRQKTPFNELVEKLNLEIERYEHLAEALRRLPPVLDKIDALPDSLSAVMDTIALKEKTHHHDHSELYDIDGRYIQTDEILTGEGVAGEHHDDDDGDHDGHHEDEPFFLDLQGCEDRDSCLAYTLNILAMYTEMRDRIVTDQEHYESMSARLEENYNYARDRYRLIQRDIFIDGQDNYAKVLRSLPRYVRSAVDDTRRKYGIGDTSDDALILSQSDWRGGTIVSLLAFILFGIIVATLLSYLAVRLLRKKVSWFQTESFKKRSLLFTLLSGVVVFAIAVMIYNLVKDQSFFRVTSGLLLTYCWLLIAILVSLLIRIPSDNIRKVAPLYLPIAMLGLLVITFRIFFIPNKLVNLVFPPILLAFTIWQYILCRRVRNQKEARGDMLYSWITFAVMLGTLVVSCCGYVLLSVQLFIWWLFQLTAIETITALRVLLDKYESKYIIKRRLQYKKDHNVLDTDRKDSFIAVTWMYDFIKQACLPILMILSIPLCLWLASSIFDLTEICKDVFYRPFFNLADKDGNEILHLSIYKIVVVSALFFLFKYFSYLLKAVYRRNRTEKLLAREGKTYIHTNEINFTLANNVIAILVWGSYIVIAIVLLKIPMGALSIVAAGLATGLGLAMKDILNNFIYGIQLMSGRLRVGDYIECDGVRGKVTSISYQTTQIQAVDDTLIAFTNTTLFNKNFKNLTRSSAYEYVKVAVGVSYGTDIDQLKEVLQKASEKLKTKDKYGRSVVDPKRGISVAFDDFGDSSIVIALKQYVLVEERYGYIARAKELLYKTLNENGIEIPFPQQDVYIKSIAR